jgi:short-subunit dehydrogenase
MSERPTALVTGAASGIGAEFARLLAADGHDVVLVARWGQAMEEMAQYVEERYGVEAVVIPKDLDRRSAAEEVVENLRQRHHDRVDVLVNLVWPAHVTDLLVPGMVERGRGVVLNLAPSDEMSVIAASLALRKQVRSSGVSVTAVCPGRPASGVSAPAEVAEWSWRAARSGKPLAVHGLRRKLAATRTRLWNPGLAGNFSET